MKKHVYSIYTDTITILVIGFLCIMPLSPVYAAVFAVNDNGDASDIVHGDGICATATGACTLRAAIEEANSISGPDTVTIPGMTIVLSSELVISDSLSVSGSGEGITIVDGNNTVRVFTFLVSSGTHTISDLTIQNANGTGNGGGIFNEATLNVSNVTLTNNQALQGGGIYNQFAFGVNVPELQLNFVEIINNTATSTVLGEGGGGLFNGSKLIGSEVVIEGNLATQGGGYYNNSFQTASLTNFSISSNTAKYGGGVDNDLGDISLNNGTIEGNVAECCGIGGGTDYTGGGGIYNNEGSIALTGVVISGNNATSPGGYGGGIYNYQDMTLDRVSVTENYAAYGAGIFNGNYDAQPNDISMTNVTISGNIGTSSSSPFIQAVGAGIYNTDNGQIGLINTTVSENAAVLAGGINNQITSTSVNLTNSILANNSDSLGSPDCKGLISSGGNNLLGNSANCSFGTQSTDLINIDPKLNLLTGSPSYHSLNPSSPAIDTGNNSSCPGIDIRFVNRPQNGTCDIGSFEYKTGTDTIGVYRSSEHVWYLRDENSSGANTIPAILYGSSVDLPVVGDWGGDGVDTIGVYRPSEHIWYLRDDNSSGMNTIPAIYYGADGDIPIVGDWNGDGIDTIGIYRPTEHVWYLRDSNSSGFNTIPAILYGMDGDIPVVGDWNDDGIDTIGIYRPTEHVWYLRDSNTSGANTIPAILYGMDGDIPVVGDWNGDDTDTIGVHRPSEHVWYLRDFNSSGMNSVPAIYYGATGDAPVVGDWDGL